MLKVYQAKKHLMDYNMEITAINLKNTLLGKGETKRYILEEFETYNQKMKNLVGIEYVIGTCNRYATALAHAS